MSFTKSLLFPIAYSTLYILSICFTFYGGHQKSLNAVYIIGWLMLIPFCVAAMVYAKKAHYQNQISGRDAAKEGLKFIILSSVILIVFQTVFFMTDLRDFKINYFETYGPELAREQIKQGKLTISEKEIPGLIKSEVAQISLFRECTSILFKNLFLGVITTIFGAVALKSKNS